MQMRKPHLHTERL